MLVKMPVVFACENMVVHQTLTSMGTQSLHFRKLHSKHLNCLFLLPTAYPSLDMLHRNGRYVPTHLHLMVFELVKNSVRAVQERFMESDKVAPPVRIIVADGVEDVTIKACVFIFPMNEGGIITI